MKRTSIILLIGVFIFGSQFPCMAQIEPPEDIEDILTDLNNSNLSEIGSFIPREVILRFDPSAGMSIKEQRNILDTTAYITIKENKPTPITQFWLCTITTFPSDLETSNNQEDSIRGVIKRVSTINTDINSGGLNYVFNTSPVKINPNLNGLPTLLENYADSFSVSILYGPHKRKVGFTDTGISPAHSSLFEPYINSGKNYVSFGEPKDDNGHGTHMASILINAIPRNATFRPRRSIPSLHIHKTHNASGQSTLFDVLQSIDQCIIDRVEITNMSFSYYADYADRNDSQNPLRIAMETAGDRVGTLFITAAGNEDINNDNSSNDISYPASFDLENIIAVAAVDSLGDLADYSGRGKESVDIAAPGKAIIGAYLNKNEYAEITGTSPATAIVTRVATMLASHQRRFNYQAIKCALLSSVTRNSSLNGKVKSGGYINAVAALDALNSNKCSLINRITNSLQNITTKPLHISSSITPTTINLTIDALQSQLGMIRIFTTEGQLLHNEKIILHTGENQVQWTFPEQNFSNLYFVQVQVGLQLETIKVLR